MCSNTCHSWLPGLVVRKGSQEWLTVEYYRLVCQHRSRAPLTSNKTTNLRHIRMSILHKITASYNRKRKRKRRKRRRGREKRKRKRRKKKRRRRRTRTRIGEREGEQSSKGSEEEMGKANCITSKTVCLPHTLYMYIYRHKYAYGHEVASGSENGKTKVEQGVCCCSTCASCPSSSNSSS